MSRESDPTRVHYIHRLSFSARERLVGIFVLAGIALILALLFAKGKTAHLFEDRVTFHAYLQHAQGISTQSLVKISGIEVGRVSSIDISDENKIHITFYVFERFHELVRADSTAALSKLSLLGDATIEIKAGSPGLPVIPAGSIIALEEPLSMDEVMAELTPVMDQLKRSLENVTEIIDKLDPERIGSMVDDASVTITNLRAMSEQITAGEGVVGRVVFDQRLADTISDTIDVLNETARRTDAQLAALGPVVDKGDKLAGNALEMSDEAKALIVDTRRAVAKVNEALKGISDELSRLPETMTRARRLMQSGDETLQGVQRVWPLSKALENNEEARPLPPRAVDE